MRRYELAVIRRVILRARRDWAAAADRHGRSGFADVALVERLSG
jgi:hypothetical protein